MSRDMDLNVFARNQWSSFHSALALKELLNQKIGHSPPFPDPEHPWPIFLERPIYLGPGDLLPKFPASYYSRDDDFQAPSIIPDAKVAIIGAGAAGLFTAMILDYLRSKVPGFNVSYDIFEAAGEDRVGGRLFTYQFQPPDTVNSRVPRDYYDVGAMRFPENNIMTRLFDLFRHLDMRKWRLSDDAPPGSLVPYYMENINDHGYGFEPWCFNNTTKWGNWKNMTESDPDTFGLNSDAESENQKIPLSILTESPSTTFNQTVDELRQALRLDLETTPPGYRGFELLMSYDQYSTRQFLAMPPPGASLPPYNYQTIQFLETFTGGTNSFDQAFSESVLDTLDFEYSDDPQKNVWWTVLGGTQQLAKKMERRLQSPVTYRSRVTAIRVGDTADMEIDIQKTTSDGNTPLEKKEYNGVFNTTTLGALQRIDTKNTHLTYTARQAIRSLGYGASSKVGIKFSRAWWIHDLPNDFKIKRGGLGHSDLSIRTCVYPSYNIRDGPDIPAVLLCSYTWQQDADRIGALVSRSGNHDQQVKEEAALRELILRDLARLHAYPASGGQPGKSEEEMYNLISSLYIDHYAHNWTSDPNTAGAFALYRPQQFSEVWGRMIQPAGNLIIIGEATSPHHAWVVGALESAVHGVCLWLKMRYMEIPGARQAIELLEKAEEGNPFVGLPPYMDKIISDWSAWNAADDLRSRARKNWASAAS
ncbi:hypothetical protein O1611_g5621 [Lasiodiplodia mahajangana]|uniref:Uncharacterized protein n=1 Tax=Lasiodiplodia mahajangana TaxID=1108764 RepID=A0ACC2JKI2_9PEZI|nr:hypothetical protein O1611_g5621 [Lasiodiplodia mahajangana]